MVVINKYHILGITVNSIYKTLFIFCNYQ